MNNLTNIPFKTIKLAYIWLQHLGLVHSPLITAKALKSLQKKFLIFELKSVPSIISNFFVPFFALRTFLGLFLFLETIQKAGPWWLR